MRNGFSNFHLFSYSALHEICSDLSFIQISKLKRVWSTIASFVNLGIGGTLIIHNFFYKKLRSILSAEKCLTFFILYFCCFENNNILHFYYNWVGNLVQVSYTGSQ